jgi:release factor glutamine methyltransferase
MLATEATTVGAALAQAVETLRAAGSPTPRLDAELLIAFSAARDRSWVLAHPEAGIDADALDALLRRRAAGEPIAYIRGFKEWHSLGIRTDARALIPRPETELLADTAVDEVRARLASSREPVVVWEIGTGSGAVAVVLAQRLSEAIRGGRARILASDISADALELAAENLAGHGIRESVTLFMADLLGPAGDDLPRPDVVVANLPYVASSEVDERQGSLGYEPRIAVDGGRDGLEVLRRLFADLPSRTAPGATVLLEIGVGQAESIRALASPGTTLSVVPDLAGLDRVVRVQVP